ncbi:MAG: hypothetical protein ACE5JS_08620 [Nitrospinota bacterium]
MKTVEGIIGIGFATLLGIGALFIAGLLALAQGVRTLAIAAFSGTVSRFKSFLG